MIFLSDKLENIIFLSTIALFSEYDKMSKREGLKEDAISVIRPLIEPYRLAPLLLIRSAV